MRAGPPASDALNMSQMFGLARTGTAVKLMHGGFWRAGSSCVRLMHIKGPRVRACVRARRRGAGSLFTFNFRRRAAAIRSGWPGHLHHEPSVYSVGLLICIHNARAYARRADGI